MLSGIYSLYWETSDAIYIGKSIDICSRFRDHINKLKAGTHTNYKLQKEYTLYGIPVLNIIEEINSKLEDVMYEKEIEWIKEFDSFYNGCNLSKGGDSGPVYKGAEHPNSTLTEEQLKSAFNALYENTLTQKEISIKYGVPKGVIERIAQGTGHKWLEEQFPDKYKAIMSIDRTFRKLQSKNFGINGKGISYPSIISPEGVIYNNIVNLTLFAKDNGLQAGNLHKLFNKERLSHKGWHLQA